MQDYYSRRRRRGTAIPTKKRPRKETVDKLSAQPDTTEGNDNIKPPKPQKPPRRGLGIKITCCVLALLLTAGAVLGHFNRYEILKYLDERETPELTLTSLSAADPVYAADRYTYTPLAYTPADGSGYSLTEQTLGLELVAGTDFLKSESPTSESVREELENIFKFAVNMQIGLVILPLQSDLGALFNTEEYDTVLNGEIIAFAKELAADGGIKLGVVYSPFEWQKDGKSVLLDPALPSDREQAVKTAADISALGADIVMMKNCAYSSAQGGYAEYAALNIGTGYEVYRRNMLSDTLYEISLALHTNTAQTMLGLSVDPVWKLASSSTEGIDIVSDYQDYSDGYADTLAWLSNGIFDFVSVNDYDSLTDDDAPFETVAAWWSNAALAADIPLFITHDAEKIATKADGWVSYDQLPKQVLAAKEYGGYAGSILRSASRLMQYSEIAAVVTNSFKGSIDGDDILRRLAITYPKKKSTTTYESMITMSGSSDPNFSVFINGEQVERTSKGYFSLNFDLKVGKNTYVIEHKGSSVTYTIERKVLVIQSVDPTEEMTVYAGTQIVFSAVALKGSKMIAVVDGEKIEMVEDAILLDESTQAIGDYINYTGVYKIPENSKSRTISGIEIQGDWEGYKSTKKCADVKVKEIDKTTVRVATVTAEYGAEVFRYQTVDDKSTPITYALPIGTRDFIIGESTYQFTSGSSKYTYVYYLLQSGKRIYKSKNGVDVGQVTVAYGETVPSNDISEVLVGVNSEYTTVSFEMSSKIPFTLELLPQEYDDAESIAPDFTIAGDCSATYVKLTFSYTTSIPELPTLENSPLFSSIDGWHRDDDGNYYLIFRLYGAGRFFGVYDEYTGNTLTFQFNNPPVMSTASNAYGYSLAGVKIVLDPGHGGVSQTGNTATGAIGANPNYPEKRINLELGLKIKNILESLGATVYMTRTDDSFLELTERGIEFVDRCRPDLFISIHHNWADSVSAIGTDSFYYMPFSKNLAGSIYNRMFRYYQTNMYPNSGNTNYGRGVQYYPFGMTRYWSCPSTLVEYGFMSNAAELQKIIDPDVQNGFARATVQGIIDYVKTFGTVSGVPYVPDNDSDPGIIETEDGYYDENGEFIYWENPLLTSSATAPSESSTSESSDSNED